jgi:hypothetical protein
MKYLAFILLSTLLLTACNPSREVASTEEAPTQTTERKLAKFEPADGKCILFVGQELEALGGLEDYADGYYDHFPAPGGFTMYTGISTGDNSFGHTMVGLDGIWKTHDWGDGPNNMSLQLADEDFADQALAIGFWMVNHEKEIAKGGFDNTLRRFGNWLKEIAPRPVFLRIGYEFAGPWNNYDQKAYKKAFRRIHEMYDTMGVTNVAYVWQSHGADEPMEVLEAWYPGDDVVDWCSYSFFNRHKEANMVEFARKKGKPCFIAEATPTITHPDPARAGQGKTKQTMLGDPEQGEEAWELWFKPFFKTIHDNPDVVKAVSYINANWTSHRMWDDNPTFQEVDARLQINPVIKERWLKEVTSGRYITGKDDVYGVLGVE